MPSMASAAQAAPKTFPSVAPPAVKAWLPVSKAAAVCRTGLAGLAFRTGLPAAASKAGGVLVEAEAEAADLATGAAGAVLAEAAAVACEDAVDVHPLFAPL